MPDSIGIDKYVIAFDPGRHTLLYGIPKLASGGMEIYKLSCNAYYTYAGKYKADNVEPTGIRKLQMSMMTSQPCLLKLLMRKSDSDTIASVVVGNNDLGTALIICSFARLLQYIDELNNEA